MTPSNNRQEKKVEEKLLRFLQSVFLPLSTKQKKEKKLQKQWLEEFCKYRHICEFLGSEGKEKEEIKEYLMQELGLPEEAARYQITRTLESEDGIVKSFGWKFYLDEGIVKAVIEDLRSIYPIRLKPYPYPPKEETEARDGLIGMKKKYAALQLEYDLLCYRYLDVKAVSQKMFKVV